MARGRRQQHTTSERHTTLGRFPEALGGFPEALAVALAGEEGPIPPGRDLVTHLRELALHSVDFLFYGEDGWHRALRQAFAETLVRDGAKEAYAGLGWAVAHFRGSVEDEDAATHSFQLEGEVAAATRLLEIWPYLDACRAPRPKFAEMVLEGESAAMCARLASDGVGGDAAALMRVLSSTHWRLGAPFAGLDAEFGHLVDALRQWRADAQLPPPPAVAVLDVVVSRAETLAGLCALGGADTTALGLTAERSVLTAHAALIVDGAPIVVYGHLPAPEEVHGGQMEQVVEWAQDAHQGSRRTLPVSDRPLPAHTGLSARLRHDDVGRWHTCTRRALAPSPRCAHAGGLTEWIRNETATALVLDCEECGRTQRALCWRDRLPTSHGDHIDPASAEGFALGHLRGALRAFGPQQATGEPWTVADMDPTRFGDPAPRLRPAASPAGSAEGLLTRRRAGARTAPRVS